MTEYDAKDDGEKSYYAAIEAKRQREALKRYGFSAFKAAEIVLDACRGDAYALEFVKLADGSK